MRWIVTLLHYINFMDRCTWKNTHFFYPDINFYLKFNVLRHYNNTFKEMNCLLLVFKLQ